MEILTVKEVAIMLRYSEKHIRRMCKEGKIPYRQQSGGERITFLKEEIEAWWMQYHTSPVKTKIQQFRNLHR